MLFEEGLNQFYRRLGTERVREDSQTVEMEKSQGHTHKKEWREGSSGWNEDSMRKQRVIRVGLQGLVKEFRS